MKRTILFSIFSLAALLCSQSIHANAIERNDTIRAEVPVVAPTVNPNDAKAIKAAYKEAEDRYEDAEKDYKKALKDFKEKEKKYKERMNVYKNQMKGYKQQLKAIEASEKAAKNFSKAAGK